MCIIVVIIIIIHHLDFQFIPCDRWYLQKAKTIFIVPISQFWNTRRISTGLLYIYGCIDQTGSILLGTCSFNMNAVFHCAHVTVYSVDQKIKIMAQGSTYSLLSDERKRQHKSRYMLNVDIITLLSTRSSGTLDQYSANMRGGKTSWLSVQVFYCCPLHHASASAHWVLPLRIQLTTMNPCTGSPCTEWLLMNMKFKKLTRNSKTTTDFLHFKRLQIRGDNDNLTKLTVVPRHFLIGDIYTNDNTEITH